MLGTAAGISAGSRTVIQIVCLSCGCQWLPGTRQEHTIRALSGRLGYEAKLAAEDELRSQQEERKRQTDPKAGLERLAAWLAIIGTIVFLIYALVAGLADGV